MFRATSLPLKGNPELIVVNGVYILHRLSFLRFLGVKVPYVIKILNLFRLIINNIIFVQEMSPVAYYGRANKTIRLQIYSDWNNI
jgi:hypothetical protein